MNGIPILLVKKLQKTSHQFKKLQNFFFWGIETPIYFSVRLQYGFMGNIWWLIPTSPMELGRKVELS